MPTSAEDISKITSSYCVERALPTIISKMYIKEVMRLANDGTFGRRIVLTEKTNKKIQDAIWLYNSLTNLKGVLENMENRLVINVEQTEVEMCDNRIIVKIPLSKKINNTWKNLWKKLHF